MGPIWCSKLCLAFSITIFILQFSNHFIRASHLANDQSINNDYIKNFYFKDLLNNANSLIINADRNLDTETLNALLVKGRYAKYIEIFKQPQLFKSSVDTEQQKISSLVDLMFPFEVYGHRELIEAAIDSNKLNSDRFQLEFINITYCGLTNDFLDSFKSRPSLIHSTLFHRFVIDFFTHLRVIKFSSNNFTHLERKTFELFSASPVEALLFDSNQLTTVRHDTFYDMPFLKLIDLSHNHLKVIHPLTFLNSFNIFMLNLADNQLKAIFNTPKISATNQTTQLMSLKYLYLKNNNLMCDSGLVWLFNRKNNLTLDDFECKYNSSKAIEFSSIEFETTLENYSSVPSINIDSSILEKSSYFSLLNLMSKQWFAWNVFIDVLPVTTPFPYLMSKDKEVDENFDRGEKHVFHSWYMSDLVLKCSSDSKSTILWKTQYGYLSFMPEENYKIFYQMNTLTKISQNISVTVGRKFGGQTTSNFFVNSKNELTVTNMRQAVSGPFVCISLNEKGIKTYEYDLYVRTGVGENFINSLMASLAFSLITLTIGIISCCILEHKANKNFPQTPPYYPTPLRTPLASTPPNFDFNEWMSNAASYLPNINIHDTLEQVSKKLRKGMEKASVTVKSLGLTSTAYIYSVYEHGTQRWSDIKSYVPTLNVPTITMPTMRYTPVSILANRMRTGVGNIFIPIGKFCGTTDLAHTASINDLQADTNASNSIGKILILDQMDLKNSQQNIHQHYQGYYKFLNFLKEESKKNKNKNSLGLNLSSNNDGIDDKLVSQIIVLETPSSLCSSSSDSTVTSLPPSEHLPASTSLSECLPNAQHCQPTTSSAALHSSAKPKLNLIVAYINPKNQSLKIENIDEEPDENE
jgi:hypothetical protein